MDTFGGHTVFRNVGKVIYRPKETPYKLYSVFQ